METTLKAPMSITVAHPRRRALPSTVSIERYEPFLIWYCIRAASSIIGLYLADQLNEQAAVCARCIKESRRFLP